MPVCVRCIRRGQGRHLMTLVPAPHLITRERQRNCLQQCVLSLTNCINLGKENLVDLQAEELRMCLKSLAQLTGEVDVEEILDIVFSEFCIGK